jgi:CDP-6-deoxy-D-xylo-4-hexulose-3-dehydrase
MELLTFLEMNEVQTRVCFAGNITRHPAFEQYKQPFENSDTIMRNAFLLGAHHGMDTEDVDYVCDLLKKFESTKV